MKLCSRRLWSALRTGRRRLSPFTPSLLPNSNSNLFLKLTVCRPAPYNPPKYQGFMATFKTYLKALRLPFLTGSLLPVAAATALAYWLHQAFNPGSSASTSWAWPACTWGPT